MADLLSDVMVAPIGVAVLAGLEAMHRDDAGPWSPPGGVSSGSVRDAVAWLKAASFGDLIEVTLDIAHQYAGPWWPSSPRLLARCFADAPGRRRIGEALVDRFGDALSKPVDRLRQESWRGSGSWAESPRFVDFALTYDSGEFTFGGLFTCTAPPPQAHDLLAATHELFPGPISRLALPVLDTAEVWEVNQPQDWAQLVLDHPHTVADDVISGGWELPGPDQAAANVAGLVAVAGATACRTEIDRHLVPDWASVAATVDGVHLSWAGYLTTEARVIDLPDGSVTRLRYWQSERTLWLADVFGRPGALPAPSITDHHDDDARWADLDWQRRADADLALMYVLLDRPR